MSISRIESIPHFKNFIENIQCDTSTGRYRLINTNGEHLSIRKVTSKISALIAEQSFIQENIVVNQNTLRVVELGITEEQLQEIRSSAEVAIQYLDLFNYEEILPDDQSIKAKIKSFIKWVFHIKPLSDPKNRDKIVHRICKAYEQAISKESLKIKEYNCMSPKAKRALGKNLKQLKETILSAIVHQNLRELYPVEALGVEIPTEFSSFEDESIPVEIHPQQEEPEAPALPVPPPPPPPPPMPEPKPKVESSRRVDAAPSTSSKWVHIDIHNIVSAREGLKKTGILV